MSATKNIKRCKIVTNFKCIFTNDVYRLSEHTKSFQKGSPFDRSGHGTVLSFTYLTCKKSIDMLEIIHREKPLKQNEKVAKIFASTPKKTAKATKPTTATSKVESTTKTITKTTMTTAAVTKSKRKYLKISETSEDDECRECGGCYVKGKLGLSVKTASIRGMLNALD